MSNHIKYKIVERKIHKNHFIYFLLLLTTIVIYKARVTLRKLTTKLKLA